MDDSLTKMLLRETRDEVVELRSINEHQHIQIVELRKELEELQTEAEAIKYEDKRKEKYKTGCDPA